MRGKAFGFGQLYRCGADGGQCGLGSIDEAGALHEIEHRLSSFKTEIPLAERENELGERRRKMAEIAYSNGEIDSTQVIQAIQQAQQSAYAYQRVLMEQQHLISQYNQIVGVIP